MGRLHFVETNQPSQAALCIGAPSLSATKLQGVAAKWRATARQRRFDAYYYI